MLLLLESRLHGRLAQTAFLCIYHTWKKILVWDLLNEIIIDLPIFKDYVSKIDSYLCCFQKSLIG